jgi:ribonuclease HII
VDGRAAPPGLRVSTVIGGDRTRPQIAAASIVAKVARDRAMARLGARRPGWGWTSNVGYGTAEHAAALRREGPTPHHRLSFRPVAAARP